MADTGRDDARRRQQAADAARERAIRQQQGTRHGWGEAPAHAPIPKRRTGTDRRRGGRGGRRTGVLGFLFGRRR